jgi:hypothetical protein
MGARFASSFAVWRVGHGDKNMAIARRFGLSLVHANKSKRSVKTRRKSASWDTSYLLELLQFK